MDVSTSGPRQTRRRSARPWPRQSRCSGVAGCRLSDGLAVGRQDPCFQVPADADRRLIVARVDAPAVLDELWLVSRLCAGLIARPSHPVAPTYDLRVEQPWVLPGENLFGDQQERIRRLDFRVAVARYQRISVLRLCPGIVGH